MKILRYINILIFILLSFRANAVETVPGNTLIQTFAQNLSATSNIPLTQEQLATITPAFTAAGIVNDTTAEGAAIAAAITANVTELASMGGDDAAVAMAQTIASGGTALAQSAGISVDYSVDTFSPLVINQTYIYDSGVMNLATDSSLSNGTSVFDETNPANNTARGRVYVDFVNKKIRGDMNIKYTIAADAHWSGSTVTVEMDRSIPEASIASLPILVRANAMVEQTDAEATGVTEGIAKQFTAVGGSDGQLFTSMLNPDKATINSLVNYTGNAANTLQNFNQKNGPENGYNGVIINGTFATASGNTPGSTTVNVQSLTNANTTNATEAQLAATVHSLSATNIAVTPIIATQALIDSRLIQDKTTVTRVTRSSETASGNVGFNDGGTPVITGTFTNTANGDGTQTVVTTQASGN
jgi:hypothetical protein